MNNATPTDGQVLTWDNANSYWKPATAASGGSDTFIRYSEYTALQPQQRTPSLVLLAAQVVPVMAGLVKAQHWIQTWAVTSLLRCMVEHQVGCHHQAALAGQAIE